MFYNHAVATEDYISLSNVTVRFNIGDGSKTISVIINDDRICETQYEIFFISVSPESDGTDPNYAEVIIDDFNEPECCKFSTTLRIYIYKIESNMIHISTAEATISDVACKEVFFIHLLS